VNLPSPQEFVGTNDTFGESGTPSQLMEKYGLSSKNIITKVEKVLERK
jgi:transketolase